MMWLFEHAVPQLPQWSGSVSVLVSQPSISLFELQSAYPVSHVPLQTLAAHVGFEM